MFWLWRLIWHVDLRGWVPEPSVRCGSECVWDAVFGGVALESGFWAIRGAPSRQLKASREHKEFLLPRGILVRTGSLSPLDLDLGCSVSSPWVSSLSAYGLEPGHRPSWLSGLRAPTGVKLADCSSWDLSALRSYVRQSLLHNSIYHLSGVCRDEVTAWAEANLCHLSIYLPAYLPAYLPTCLPAYLAVCAHIPTIYSHTHMYLYKLWVLFLWRTLANKYTSY